MKGNKSQGRLRILGDDEIQALYGIPHFTPEERLEYFSLSPTELTAMERDYTKLRNSSVNRKISIGVKSSAKVIVVNRYLNCISLPKDCYQIFQSQTKASNTMPRWLAITPSTS
jgi:hypothetical protein